MLRTGFLLWAVIVLVAVSACGGDGSDGQAPQAGVTPSNDAQTETTGANAGAANQGSTGTSRSEPPPAVAEDQRKRSSESKKSADKGKQATQRKPGKQGKRKPKSAWDYLSAKDLYSQGRAGCRALGLEQIATEYQARSQTAADAAAAYADAFLRGGAPRRVWKPIYEGCVAGLTGH